MCAFFVSLSLTCEFRFLCNDIMRRCTLMRLLVKQVRMNESDDVVLFSFNTTKRTGLLSMYSCFDRMEYHDNLKFIYAIIAALRL